MLLILTTTLTCIDSTVFAVEVQGETESSVSESVSGDSETLNAGDGNIELEEDYSEGGDRDEKEEGLNNLNRQEDGENMSASENTPGKDEEESEKDMEEIIVEEKTVTASGVCGDNLTWIIENRVLKIFGTGDMWDFSTIHMITDAPWEEYSTSINSLMISEGITRIGDCAFSGMTGIYGNLVIPESVISIGEYAFRNCRGFTGDLTIPDGVIYIGLGAFTGCDGFRGNLTIPDNITNIEQDTFCNCTGFTGNLIIPTSVTNIDVGAFQGCSRFSGELIIPPNVTNIGLSAFRDCSGFAGDLKISSSVSDIGNFAFYGCTGIDGNLIISDGVKSIGSYAFAKCKSLNCIVLEEIVPSIGDNAFEQVIAKIYYPSWKLNWDSIIGNNFGGTLTWIPYYENTQPWEIDMSDDIPQIGIISDCDENVTYVEEKGYLQNSFSIAFSAFYLYGEETIAYSDAKIVVTLPEGLSFSDISDVRQREYLIEVMNNSDEFRKKDFRDFVYIATEEKKELFDIEFSVVADECSKTRDSILRVPISIIRDYSSYELQIYSQITSCTTSVNDCFELRPLMVKGEDVLGNETGYSFAIEDTNIIDIVGTDYDDYGPIVKLEGKSVGDTTLQITHIASGKDITIKLSVIDGMRTYNVSNLLSLPDGQGIFNAEIFLDSFEMTRHGKGYDITFKAYNGRFHTAAVEVYDKDGKLIGFDEINKFERYETGLKAVWDSAANLLVSTFNGTLDSFKNPLYSQESTVKIWVPDDGYFVVTNNLSRSVGTFIFNAVDLFCFAASEATKEIKAGEELKEVTQKAQEETVQQYIAKMKTIEEQQKFLDGLQKKVFKAIGKKVGTEAASEIIGDFITDSEIYYEEFDINLESIFIDAAKSSGFSIAQDAFIKLGGPAGKVLKSLFEVSTYINRFMQLVNMCASGDAVEVKIYVNGENDFLISNDVIVQRKDNVSLADHELIVTDITREDGSQYIIQKFNGIDRIRIMDITMYRDKQEVQPDGIIRIKIPLPIGYSWENSCIYRVEEDGTLTDMKAVYGGGYMSFETEHLSTYVLVEKKSVENGDILPEDIPANGTIPDGLWAAGISDTTYTGAALTQSFRLYDGTKLLKEKTDYTVSYKNNKLAYTYTDEDYTAFEQTLTDTGKRTKTGTFDPAKAPQVVIKMKGNYTGTRILYFRIRPADITGDAFSAGNLTVTYSGKKQMPSPTLTWNGKTLKFGTDFHIPEYDSAKTDKTAFTQPGTYNLTVTGKNNFTGEIPATLTISENSKQIAMNKVSVKGVKNHPWTGTQIMPSGFTVSCQKDVLSETNGDYIVSFGENTAVGVGTVILTGTGTDGDGDGYSYIGTKTVSFKITGTAMNKVTVGGIAKNYTYTGESIEPDAVLTYQANKNASPVTLTEGIHYTVDYQKNTDKGTATVIFTGLADGGYTGTKKQTFKIVSSGIEDRKEGTATVENISVSFKDASNVQNGVYIALYMKGGATPQVTVTSGSRTLVSGKDYTVSYLNNKKPALSTDVKSPTVVVKGKGNYTGSKQVPFSIAAKALTNENGIKVVAADKTVSTKKNGYRQNFKIYDSDGKALGTGDYEKGTATYTLIQTENADGTFTDKNELLDKDSIVPAGSVIQITVQGKGIYAGGSASGTYRILNSGYDISKATIQISNQPYTGNPVRITEQGQFKEGKVYVKIGKEKRALILGQDIEVVPDSYVRNINKGTAKVTFRGINGFGGTKTVSYKIGVRSIADFWKGIFNRITKGS